MVGGYDVAQGEMCEDKPWVESAYKEGNKGNDMSTMGAKLMPSNHRCGVGSNPAVCWPDRMTALNAISVRVVGDSVPPFPEEQA